MARFMDNYMNEWVLWGGVPHRRHEVYRWMQENNCRYLETAGAPALDPEEAEALRALFDAADD